MPFFTKKSSLVVSSKVLVMFLLVGLVAYHASPVLAGPLDNDTAKPDPTEWTNTTAPQGAPIPSSPDPNPINTPAPTTGNPAGDGSSPGKVTRDTSGLKANCTEESKDAGWIAWAIGADSLWCTLPATIAIAVINVELVVLNIIAAFMQWMIQYPILNLSAVIVAWQFLRDLVNICFVLAMILMSFATMLNITQYTYRNLLFKVILGALLINFSLVFVGFFLDLNAISSTFMLNQMGTEQGLADLIVNSSNITSIAGKDDAGAPLLTILGMPGFILIIIVVFLVILIPMIVRVVYLIQYVVTSPLIWLQYIFVEAEWKKWWQGFFAWCFMPTVTLFFIYLAFAIYAPMQAATQATLAKGETMDVLVSMAITAVILGTLLMSAVAAAWKGMDKLAQMAIMLASGIGGMVGKQLLGVVAKTGLGAAAKNIGGNWAQKGLKMQGGPFGIKGLAGNMLTRAGQVGQKAGEKLREPLTKETVDKIAIANKDTVETKVKQFSAMTPEKMSAEQKVEAAAWMKKHAENGEKFDSSQTENAYKILSAEGNKEEREKNMEWFEKNLDKFDAKSLTDLTTTSVGIDGTVKTGAAKNNDSLRLATINHLNKVGAPTEYAQKLIDEVNLTDEEINKAMRDRFKDKMKDIGDAYIECSKEIVGAKDKAKAKAQRILSMSSADRAKLNTDHLMNQSDGAEVVTLSGGTIIPQLLQSKNARSHLDALRNHLESKARAAGQTMEDYTKTNHAPFHNSIARLSHHINLVDPTNPMANWKPSKKKTVTPNPGPTTRKPAPTMPPISTGQRQQTMDNTQEQLEEQRRRTEEKFRKEQEEAENKRIEEEKIRQARESRKRQEREGEERYRRIREQERQEERDREERSRKRVEEDRRQEEEARRKREEQRRRGGL